ncbi:MAG: tRNA uridine-5-carboxymethylaminomethyl(34) synthesis GTPase MnmE, partial [Clostridia bacterium]|nr:tRNA uridine-5-carboxymethylaminomethyl(34) synthesis GTPase MnmE [Clostridia bacterium]
MKNDVIAACSTAAGAAGVAVIRLSGDDPLSIAEKMFIPAGKTKVADFEPYRMYAGELDGGTFKDFGLCVYFKAPKSFTGEDV